MVGWDGIEPPTPGFSDLPPAFRMPGRYRTYRASFLRAHPLEGGLKGPESAIDGDKLVTAAYAGCPDTAACSPRHAALRTARIAGSACNPTRRMDTFLSRASTVSQSHKHPEVILHVLHERLTWVRIQQGTEVRLPRSYEPAVLKQLPHCGTNSLDRTEPVSPRR
jgi:hypothetical protein